MPNFDGGHYFLTVLAPIDTTRLYDRNGVKSSAVHMVRAVLATMPTALQTKASEWIGLNSPFARTTVTHFARFAVIDDVIYNGRTKVNSLVMALAKINPVTPQAQDRLSCPFLMFAADFDAPSGDEAALRACLTQLWSSMEPELRDIFQYCVGFDLVESAQAFGSYILRCQIETTMPFNDYWITPPPLASLQQLLVRTVAGLAGIAFLVILALCWDGWPFLGALGLALLLFLVSLAIPYGIVMAHGAKPLPTAPNSDLPSVLKAIYLQQKFTSLAIAAQGQDDQTIADLFAAFVAEHRPGDVSQPTQHPGVIRS